MVQNKQERKKELENLIYFQNLVPGKQESPFIERFKQECLNDEDENNEERKQLLNEFPPVLSFSEQQKKKFYEDEAKNCQQFCCGSMQVSNDALGGVSMKQQDNYMLSTGSGKLYEGSAAQIKSEIQDDIHQESFGSLKQEQGIAGLKQFDAVVSARGQSNAEVNTNEAAEQSSYSPFQTIPKPNKE